MTRVAPGAPGGPSATNVVGNRLTLTDGTGTTTFQYDELDRLTRMTYSDGKAVSQVYDANGNRTTLTDSTGTTAFGYDTLNRLTSGAYPGTYGIWSWTYDQVGNRLTQNSPSGQTTYGYDANNRLTSGGGKTYSYDNNGNLTSISGGTTFAYDAHNRLSQANLPGGLSVQYLYNGDGLKLRRTEGSAVTRYYHDGIRPIYETNSAGSLQAQLERDIFGNLLSRQDGGGTRYYYHHDGLGSTTALTDASGNVAAQRTYDAWGNRRTSSGSAPGNYQYTGAEVDPTSGLYHMGARFYDPTIGRWLSEDPVQDEHFNVASLNFYAYVYDNPLSLVDLDGQAPVIACGGVCVRILLFLARHPFLARLLGLGMAGGATIGGKVIQEVASPRGRLILTEGWYVARTQGGMGFAHILGKHLGDFMAKFNMAATREALLGLMRNIMEMIANGRNVVSMEQVGIRIEYVVRVGDVLVKVVTEAGEIITAFPIH